MKNLLLKSCVLVACVTLSLSAKALDPKDDPNSAYTREKIQQLDVAQARMFYCLQHSPPKDGVYGDGSWEYLEKNIISRYRKSCGQETMDWWLEGSQDEDATRQVVDISIARMLGCKVHEEGGPFICRKSDAKMKP